MRRSIASQHRERLRRLAREARTEAVAMSPPPTPDELAKLIRDADAAGERAIALARTIAARRGTG